VSFDLEFSAFPTAAEAALSYALVPWDSDLFGLAIYELRCQGAPVDVGRVLPKWRAEVIERAVGPSFAFSRVQPSDLELIEVLSRSGFYAAETTLNISLPLKRFRSLLADATGRARLRAAEPADLATVRALAEETFTADRFHLDPHLPSAQADRRYGQWVERGYEAGDPLFVYESVPADGAEPEIMGFYLVRGEPGGEVDLSLAGVAGRYRRGGVGALMYEAVLRACIDLGYRVASSNVSTNNLDVVNLFTRLGFGVRSAQLTLHLYHGA
jgi:ribosomal protein S18 acetylase RimI-like enzyme